MIKKNVAYVDRMWGNVNEKECYGDMGFSFQDSPDTRTMALGRLKREHESYINSQDAVDMGDTMDEDGEFTIYEIWTANFKLNSKQDYLWSGEIIPETKKLVGLYVCATKEQAGWIEAGEYAAWAELEVKYRKED